jgi:hypothetical protein
VALPKNGQGKQEREEDGKDGKLRACMAWPAPLVPCKNGSPKMLPRVSWDR